MEPSIGDKIIDEIIKQQMFKIAEPDPNQDHIFVWASNAEEQLTAVIEKYYETKQKK